MSGRQPKVRRVGEKYGIDGLDEALIERYTRDADPLSLRKLAAYCNKRILEAAMVEGDMRPLEGEVDNMYELLTSDDVSAGMRTQARNRLASNGVDVDDVVDDFVSYQTIKRYLEDHLHVERNTTSDAETRQRRIERIYSLENRLSVVTEQTLDQLQRDHGLVLGDADVLVDVAVSCSDCGRYAPVREIIDDGGCGCQQ
jgi:hypothetical protein